MMKQTYEKLIALPYFHLYYVLLVCKLIVNCADTKYTANHAYDEPVL